MARSDVIAEYVAKGMTEDNAALVADALGEKDEPVAPEPPVTPAAAPAAPPKPEPVKQPAATEPSVEPPAERPVSPPEGLTVEEVVAELDAANRRKVAPREVEGQPGVRPPETPAEVYINLAKKYNTTPYAVREVFAQGRVSESAVKDALREGKTTGEILAEAEKRGSYTKEAEAPLTVDMAAPMKAVESEAQERMLWTEDAPEAARPGERGDLLADLILKRVVEEQGEAWLAKAVSPYTVGTMSRKDSSQHIASLAVDLLAKRGLLPVEADLSKAPPGSRRATENEWQDALTYARRTLIASRQKGLFNTLFMPDWIADAEEEVQSGQPYGMAPGEALRRGDYGKAFWQALSPPREIIGFNNKGEVITRTTSAPVTVFDYIDLPQSAIMGATRGFASTGTASGAIRGAIRSIGMREIALTTLADEWPKAVEKFSAETGVGYDEANRQMTEGMATLASLQGLALGAMATIAIPDATELLAAGKASNKIANIIEGAGRDADKAADVFEQVISKYRAGDVAEAADLEAALRKEAKDLPEGVGGPALMQTADMADAAVAAEKAAEAADDGRVVEMMDTSIEWWLPKVDDPESVARVAKVKAEQQALWEKARDAARNAGNEIEAAKWDELLARIDEISPTDMSRTFYQHPSLRRGRFRVTGPDGATYDFADYAILYGKDKVAETITRMQDALDDPTRIHDQVGELFSRAGRKWVSDTREALQAAGIAVTNAEIVDVRRALNRVAREMSVSRDGKTAVREAMRAAMRAAIPGEAQAKLRGALHKKMGAVADELAAAETQYIERANTELARAAEGVAQSTESRREGFERVIDNLRNTRDDLTAIYARMNKPKEGREPLTKEATELKQQLITVFKVSEEEADAAAVIADARARTAAKNGEVKSTKEWYKKRIAGVQEGLPKEGDPLWMLGGEKGAQRAGRTNLEEAKLRIEIGENPEAVWRETGWERGKDGAWRFEIDDQDVAWKIKFADIPESNLFGDETLIPLSDLIDHPTLFRAYPELEKVSVVKRKGLFDGGGLQGWFDDSRMTIGLTPYAKDPESTLLHEIQHVVQMIEGFAKGGNENSAWGALSDADKLEIAKTAIGRQSERVTTAAGRVSALEQVRKNLPLFDAAVAARRESDTLFEARRRFTGTAEYDAANARWYEAYQVAAKAADDLRAALGDSARGAAGMLSTLTNQAAREGTEAALDAADARYRREFSTALDELTKLQSGDEAALRKHAPLHELYRRLAGEVEARNVQRRAQIEATERQLVPPSGTEDVERNAQILLQEGLPKKGEVLAQPLVPEFVDEALAAASRRAPRAIRNEKGQRIVPAVPLDAEMESFMRSLPDRIRAAAGPNEALRGSADSFERLVKRYENRNTRQQALHGVHDFLYWVGLDAQRAAQEAKVRNETQAARALENLQAEFLVLSAPVARAIETNRVAEPPVRRAITRDADQFTDEVRQTPWFHGTPMGGVSLSDYNPLEHTGKTAGNMLGPGLYLAANPEISIGYAAWLGGKIGTRPDTTALKTVSVDPSRLLDVRIADEGDTDSFDRLVAALYRRGADDTAGELEDYGERVRDAGMNPNALDAWKWFSENYLREDPTPYLEELLETGFDGVLHHGAQDGDVLVLFDPNGTISGRRVIKEEARVLPERVFYQGADIPENARAAAVFLDDGRAVLSALKNPDISSVMHELGHVFRRDLTPPQVDALVSWARSHGIDVTAVAGRFEGTEEATRAAEELFAAGFERYLRDGKAPVPSLGQVFDKFRTWLSNIYRAVLGTPLEPDIPDDMRRVYDSLLAAQPKERIPRVFEDTNFSPVAAEFIAERAAKYGVTLDPKEILKQIDAGETIELPFEILGSDRLDVGRLGRIQVRLDQVVQANEARDQLRIPIRSRFESVREGSISQAIDNFLAREDDLTNDRWFSPTGALRKSRRAILRAIIGADFWGGARLLPPESRIDTMTGVRHIQQVIGESIRIVKERDPAKVIAYLTGGEGASRFRLGGRHVTTASIDYSSEVTRGIRRVIADLPEAERNALIELSALIGPHMRSMQELATLAETQPEIARRAAAALSSLAQEGRPRFFADLLKSAGMPQGQRGRPLFSEGPGRNMAMIVALLNYADPTMFPRVGQADDILDSARRTERFLDDIQMVFAGEAGLSGRNRVSVLLAGYGALPSVMRTLAGSDIVVSEAERNILMKFLHAEALTPQERTVAERLFKRYGYSGDLVQLNFLGDTTRYAPGPAAERLRGALEMALDEEITRGAEDLIKNPLKALIRFNKTQMIRGNFIVRNALLTMQWFDHIAFMAVGKESSIGTAAKSATRLALQGLIAIPGVPQALGLVGLLPGRATTLESAREATQTAGDWLVHFLSWAPYRVEVNDVMRADPNKIIVLGNKRYTARQLNEIAIEEGVFATFDTAELAAAVETAQRTFVSIFGGDKEHAFRVLTRQESSGNRLADIALAQMNLSPERARYFVEAGMFDPGLDYMKMIADVSETFGERERVGAMVTLIEEGVQPRQAARVVVRNLYDYANTVAPVERHGSTGLAISLLQPFWAFQKNTDRFVLDYMLSPEGAAQLARTRRAMEAGPEALSQMLYEWQVDTYGVYVDALPPEKRKQYILFREAIERHYGGPTKVPDEMVTAMRLWLAGHYGEGSDLVLYQGQLVTTPYAMRDVFATQGGLGVERYTAPPPDAAQRPTYLRDRPVVTLTPPMTEYMLNTQGGTMTDPRYTGVVLPEPQVYAGIGHMANMMSLSFYLGSRVVDATLKQGPFDYGGLDTRGQAGVKLTDVVGTVASIDRTVAFTDIREMIDPESGAPVRLHPRLAWFASQGGLSVVPAKDRRTGEQIFYLQPGFQSVAFRYMGGIELNNALRMADLKPENRDYYLGMATEIAAEMAGLRVVEYGSTASATMETPKTLKLTMSDPTLPVMQDITGVDDRGGVEGVLNREENQDNE